MEWIGKNLGALIQISVLMVTLIIFAVRQEEINGFQDKQIAENSRRIDDLSKLNSEILQRLTRVEENTKSAAEDTKQIKGIMLSIQSQK